MNTITIDLALEIDCVDQYHRKWVTERDARDKMIADCSAAHVSPPDNYWKAEREARRKFEQASYTLEALLDARSKTPLT